MKTIIYRGGIVSFEIPENWCEDSDSEGSARFYEADADTGTMRLNVLSFERKAGLTTERVASDVFHGKAYEILGGGLPMRYSLTQEEEAGELLHVHRWDILVAIPQEKWRLVCFGYTGLASPENLIRTKEELCLVDRAVRTARYSTT